MNIWLSLVLLILIITCALEIVISILNIRAIHPEPPQEFRDVLNEQEYRESQLYTQTREKFSIISNSYSTILTIFFLVFGGFNWLDLRVRTYGFDDLLSGLIFFALLVIVSFIVNLPFSIYSTFVIEEKFGFNRTTITTYFLDIIKSALIAAVLGVPLLAALLWFFMHAGPMSWLYCWGLIVFFMIVMHFLAPTVIMPLFNRFTPLDDGDLKEKIKTYAAQEQFAIQGIYLMDGSRRSTKLNAFFTGFGKFKKIVFFDTLLEKLSADQIVAVLAHEMGHFKLKHIHKMIFSSILQAGLMMFLLGQFLQHPEISKALGMSFHSVYSGLLFFGLLFSPLSMMIGAFLNCFSRSYEYAADNYAAVSSGKSAPLISGLKELSKANLSNLTPHPLNVFFNYSHPPILERIKKLRSIEG